MPELPEVEVAARNLGRWALRRTLRAVSFAAVDRPAARQAGQDVRALSGTRFVAIERVGKNLLLTFQRGRAAEPIGVWSHLGMTGKWVRRPATAEAPRFARVRLDFAAGVTLHFVDMRRFGFFRVVAGANFAALPVIAALGPDPLRRGIDPRWLGAQLARRRKQPIKVAIMDQALLPGVGNIQASEGLHRARLDPRRPASTLTAEEVRRLAAGLRASFRYTLGRFATEGADGGGRDIEYVEEPGTRNPFRVYDRAGAPCPRRDGGTITRLVQGGRTTYYCPVCQR
jgi:formamidopyrimidine-DNA glycosylase